MNKHEERCTAIENIIDEALQEWGTKAGLRRIRSAAKRLGFNEAETIVLERRLGYRTRDGEVLSAYKTK